MYSDVTTDHGLLYAPSMPRTAVAVTPPRVAQSPCKPCCCVMSVSCVSVMNSQSATVGHTDDTRQSYSLYARGHHHRCRDAGQAERRGTVVARCRQPGEVTGYRTVPRCRRRRAPQATSLHTRTCLVSRPSQSQRSCHAQPVLGGTAHHRAKSVRRLCRQPASSGAGARRGSTGRDNRTKFKTIFLCGAVKNQPRLSICKAHTCSRTRQPGRRGVWKHQLIAQRAVAGRPCDATRVRGIRNAVHTATSV